MTFEALLAHPGVKETVDLRSRFGFLAFHGGSLERMTSEIATAAARASGASLYVVAQPDDLRWHLPSRIVTPAESPKLAAFVAHVEVGVAVHGFGRMDHWRTLLLGGRNRLLATTVAAALRPRLPHYRIEDRLAEIPKDLRGVHPDNPVNILEGGGVQLELPPRVRGMGPYWAGYHAAQPEATTFVPHAQGLVDGLADAAGAWESGSSLG